MRPLRLLCALGNIEIPKDQPARELIQPVVMLNTYQDIALFIRDFEACCLPKSSWTHQAHLTAGFWYLNKHEPGEALTLIRESIQRHNVSVGTANTDTGGYHETITVLYMSAIAAHLAAHGDVPFEESLAALLASALGESAWPLAYYSRERLFSAGARRTWVEPDLQPFPLGDALGEAVRNN